MLRRVACSRVGSAVAASCSSSSSSASSSHVLAAAAGGVAAAYHHHPHQRAATLSALNCGARAFSSRSGEDDAKKNTATAKQSAAAAAASTTTTTATAAQVFATNDKSKLSTTTVGGGSGGQQSHNGTVSNEAREEHQQQQEGVAPGPASPTSGIRSIGIKLSEDDELVRAFNNFSKSVNGCTQEEFLVGVKQAYASLAVVISAFVEKAQQPLVGITETSKVIAAAQEASKMLEQEFKPETRDDPMSKYLPANATAEARQALTKLAGASPKTELHESVVQHVVSTITSIIPISRHLAESIFNIWMMQREKKVNLSSIASPADYVLDSKLVIFARLDKARMYFNSDNIGAEVDVTLNNDYLRNLEQHIGTTAPASGSAAAAEASASKEGAANKASSTTAAAASNKTTTKGNATAADDDDLEEGMIQVLTDTTANAKRWEPEEHTFRVDKKTRKLTPTSPSTIVQPTAPAAGNSHDADKTTNNQKTAEGKSATVSRLQVTCVTANGAGNDTDAAAAAAVNTAASTAASSPNTGAAKATAAKAEEKEPVKEEAHPGDCSVFIQVNGNALPPIPADARACALLTVDVVVPPERYAYNFEWFYKRIVGYENEYERIAAARVFASNSPKSLGNFLDFVMRMITGKSVEFMFSKSIGRMIGIPEDVSETPPATRKLVCMYMDSSYKWILSDMITLAPVIETKLPKA